MVGPTQIGVEFGLELKEDGLVFWLVWILDVGPIHGDMGMG